MPAPSLVPEKNDFKVLLAGFAFYVLAPDDRIAVMELDHGRLQYRAVKGKFTTDEIPRIQEFVSVGQEAFYESSPQ